MQTKRIYLHYLVALGILYAVLIGLSPLVTFFQEQALVFVYPFYYISQMVSLLPPFIMLGIVGHTLVRAPLTRALPFFAIYAAFELFLQIPLVLFTYWYDGVWTIMLALLLSWLNALLGIAFFALLILVGYFLFVKGKETAKEFAFFSRMDTSTRFLWLGAFTLLVYREVREMIRIISYLSERLWMASGEDIFDFAVSLLFPALCALLCFAVGRWTHRYIRRLQE